MSRGKSRKRRRNRSGKTARWVLAAVGAVAVLAVALVVVALNVTRAPASTYVQPSQADVVEPVKPPLAMFFGDSYTHGTGSSSDALRWTSLVATAMGWRENNLGRGRTGYAATSDVTGCGLAFCPNVVQMIGESTGSADVIVIAGGQNDLLNAAKEPEAQLASVAKAYSDARAKYPAATIVAVGPSTPGKVDATVRALDQAVQDAAATVGAKYISLIEPEVIDHATMMAPDGGHVNDSGHAAIAERVLSALR